MAALCGRISVGLLEGGEELFSAAQSPMDCALDAGAEFQSRRAAAVFRRAVRLVLNNGAVSRNATK